MAGDEQGVCRFAPPIEKETCAWATQPVTPANGSCGQHPDFEMKAKVAFQLPPQHKIAYGELGSGAPIQDAVKRKETT